MAVTGRGGFLRLDQTCGTWEEASVRIPAFDLSTRLVASASGLCYAVDGAPDGFTHVRRLDLRTGAVTELWQGHSAKRRAIDIGVPRALLVLDTLCWFAFDDAGSSLVVSCFDLKARRHFTSPPLAHPRISYVYCDQREVVSLAGSIYVLAHCDSDAARQQGKSRVLMWRLSLASGAAGAWEALPPAPTARGCFGTAALDGRLYVVGGESPEAPAVLDVVERFDPATGAWERLAPLPTPRSSPTLLEREGKLYALGGCGDCYSDDARFLWPTRVVEAYCPATNTWERLPPIPAPLSGYSACHLPPVILGA